MTSSKISLARAYLCLCILLVASLLTGSCHKIDFPWKKNLAKQYPADVAVAWMNMQLRLTKGAAGFNSIVANRSYAYVGLSLYEAIAPGIPGYQSIAPQLNGRLVLPDTQYGKKYYWPASANAALAFVSKNLFANANPSLKSAIDSLEADFYMKFQGKASTEDLERSADFGQKIGMAIFEWSKSDGGHEAYNQIISPIYIPPVGAGLWAPTPPAFSQPFHPHWGNNRSFIPGLLTKAELPPPPVYSEQPGSEFHRAASAIYEKSQQLSADDSTVAKFWADLPSNYNVPAHAANIVTQLILEKKLSLPEAAILYCKHGIAGNEALIACFASKYKYNLVRPVTYIRGVLGHSAWNPLIPTPPFPEYPSAHAVVSSAFAEVLESELGKKEVFTDHSYDHLYGSRTFDSFHQYVWEAAVSRIYGGIHYSFAATGGMKQGKKVGEAVNKLRFKR